MKYGSAALHVRLIGGYAAVTGESQADDILKRFQALRI